MAGRRQNRLQNKKHFRILFGRMQWAMLLFFMMIAILINERRNSGLLEGNMKRSRQQELDELLEYKIRHDDNTEVEELSLQRRR